MQGSAQRTSFSITRMRAVCISMVMAGAWNKVGVDLNYGFGTLRIFTVSQAHSTTQLQTLLWGTLLSYCEITWYEVYNFQFLWQSLNPIALSARKPLCNLFFPCQGALSKHTLISQVHTLIRYLLFFVAASSQPYIRTITVFFTWVPLARAPLMLFLLGAAAAAI